MTQTVVPSLPKLRPEVKQLWLAALRSGGYRQGQGCLRDPGLIQGTPDLFCCLGVLCEVAVKNNVIPEPIRYTDEASKYHYGSDTMTDQPTDSHLPSEVISWAFDWKTMNCTDPNCGKFHPGDPTLIFLCNDHVSLLDQATLTVEESRIPTGATAQPLGRYSLVQANDVDGYGFSKIADLVEEYL